MFSSCFFPPRRPSKTNSKEPQRGRDSDAQGSRALRFEQKLWKPRARKKQNLETLHRSVTACTGANRERHTRRAAKPNSPEAKTSQGLRRRARRKHVQADQVRGRHLWSFGRAEGFAVHGIMSHEDKLAQRALVVFPFFFFCIGLTWFPTQGVGNHMSSGRGPRPITSPSPWSRPAHLMPTACGDG